MAKNKSRSPRGYYTGGRVMAEGGPAPTVEVGRVAEDVPDGTSNPLQTALDAQRRAEELQDPRKRLMAEIEKMDVSDAKKRVLMSHPELVVDPFLSRAAAWHYQQALAEGHEDDSPALIERVLSGVQGEVTRVQQAARRGAIPARMPEAPRQEASPASDVEKEEKVPSHVQPAPERKNIPMSAPVSRTVTARTGGQPAGYNTLTAEEVQIAHNSFTDPSMSNTQKEMLYLKNKQKYQGMKRDGSYSVQGEG